MEIKFIPHVSLRYVVEFQSLGASYDIVNGPRCLCTISLFQVLRGSPADFRGYRILAMYADRNIIALHQLRSYLDFYPNHLLLEQAPT